MDLKTQAFDYTAPKVPSVDSSGKKNGDNDIAAVARDFTSIFYEMVLNSMRKSIPDSKLIDGGNAEDIYRSMLDGEYAKIIADQDRSNLSTMIERQLRGLSNGNSVPLGSNVEKAKANRAYFDK